MVSIHIRITEQSISNFDSNSVNIVAMHLNYALMYKAYKTYRYFPMLQQRGIYFPPSDKRIVESRILYVCMRERIRMLQITL